MLEECNPAWLSLDAGDAPDGDADLEGHDFAQFEVPPCPHCGGILKPDVVFFGEAVPRERVEAAARAWQAADVSIGRRGRDSRGCPKPCCSPRRSARTGADGRR
jgi:hypothetical protein